MTSEDVETLYPDVLADTQKHLARFWDNYARLGGQDKEWFSKAIGPLMMLPSCSRGQTTYEYKDAKGNWSKPWVVKGSG